MAGNTDAALVIQHIRRQQITAAIISALIGTRKCRQNFADVVFELNKTRQQTHYLSLIHI